MTVALREDTAPSSVLSHWDGRWKLAGFSVAMVAILSIQDPAILAASMGLVVMLLITGRVSITIVLQRWGLLLLSLIPVVLTLGISIENGWLAATVILMRTSSMAGLLLVLVLTTSTSALCAAAQQLKVPGVLLQVLALAWRYSRLLLVELQRMRIALFCRGFRMQTSGHSFQTLGYTAGTMLIRGADRSERVSEAMQARGFRGHYHNLSEFRSTRQDVMAFGVVVLTFGGLVLWDRLT